MRSRLFKGLLIAFFFCFAAVLAAQTIPGTESSSATYPATHTGTEEPTELNADLTADDQAVEGQAHGDQPSDDQAAEDQSHGDLPEEQALTADPAADPAQDAEPSAPDAEISAEPFTDSDSTDAAFETADAVAGSKKKAPQQNGVKNTVQRANISRRFDGGVTAIADSAATRSFFAAGNDGFITRYLYGTMKSETWQVSTMPVKRIAVHPKKTLVAVYETDGFSVHTISLWDWQDKKQLYTKRFTSSVVSLSWSAQGTYLFIGTASIEGITILDIKGNIKKIYPRPPGIVRLAATGPSEKSIVTYGETGRLVYADIANHSILTQYDTEDRLENPELIKNYTLIIGYKNGKVITVKAASGEIAETYPARSALFAGKISDTLPVWIEKGEAGQTWHLCQGTKKSPAFTLPHSAVVTAARHVDAAIVVGTDDGRLYRLTQAADAAISVKELNPDNTVALRDICVKGSAVYLLSGTVLYRSSTPEEKPEPVVTGITAECCTVFGSGFVFWSNTKAAPLYYAEEGQQPVVLYRMSEPLNSVSVHERTIAAVQRFSGLLLLDGITGKTLFSYQAAGLQDAVQVDDSTVLLSKSTGGVIGQLVLLINVKTGETSPLNIEGDLAFSLRANEKNKQLFSCFRLKAEDSDQTDLLLINLDSTHPARSTFTTALSYNDEDLHASLYDDGQAVLTNLGKNNLVYYDKRRRSVRQLTRDYALSRKAVMTDAAIISLNYDGSLSWFNRRSLQLIPHVPPAVD